ncbi:MAG: response regulator [bacterium]
MAPQALPKKILIVDDEPDTVAFLQMILEDNGYTTVATTQPDDVLGLVRDQNPDLITLDVLMPNKTGVKVYRELRKTSEFAKIPIVVITGVNPGDYIQTGDASSNGAPPPDAFIEKPIDSRKLLDLIRKLIEGREAGQ